MKNTTLFTLLFITLISCNNQSQPTSAQGQWIKGNEDEKLSIIENQFRGFDKTMVEVGYRYQELYWAGREENWDYADYQLQKISKTIRLGLQRRPKRAASAEHFLNFVVPDVDSSIKAKDTVLFNQKFNMMTTNCINCHAMERVPSFTVRKPLYRPSPIRKQ